MNRMSGAKALISLLEREGVQVIFGYPGGAVLPIYDALHGSKIRHVLVRHEQAAAHAADGYARVSGKVGVCLATSGPGATNLVTGIANAYMDSIPMVAITGQVARPLIGTDAFQEADITGITFPIVKHSYLVKDPEEIPAIVREAFHLAASGRPGPVLIDIPVDVAKAEIDYRYPQHLRFPEAKPPRADHAETLRGAAEAILAAKRPILYVGGGAIRAKATVEARKIAERWELPVATTSMGLGAFPGTHRLAIGHPGMHGYKHANLALSEADLILAVGVRFSDRVTGPFPTYARKARIVHVDVDPAEIGKNVLAEFPLVGDARAVLVALAEALEAAGKGRKAPSFVPWLARIARWRRQYPHAVPKGGPLKPQEVIARIYEKTGGQAIVTTDVGQCQMWTAQFYTFTRPGQWVSSLGLGTMGFGLPAAIGARLADPKADVWVIAGDGSFQMTSEELAVAVIEKLPIRVAILNNGYLGMVRQWQELMYGKRYSGSDLRRGVSPDFVKLAQAYGAKGMRVTKAAEIGPTLDRAARVKGPVVIDFVVDPAANVMPMVRPGMAISEMYEG